MRTTTGALAFLCATFPVCDAWVSPAALSVRRQHVTTKWRISAGPSEEDPMSAYDRAMSSWNRPSDTGGSVAQQEPTTFPQQQEAPPQPINTPSNSGGSNANAADDSSMNAYDRAMAELRSINTNPPAMSEEVSEAWAPPLEFMDPNMPPPPQGEQQPLYVDATYDNNNNYDDDEEEIDPVAYAPGPSILKPLNDTATQSILDSPVQPFLKTAWENFTARATDNDVFKGVFKNKQQQQQIPAPYTPPGPIQQTSRPISNVQPGVTKRIFEAMTANQQQDPRAWSPWDAFQNAEDRWTDLKNANAFDYDLKWFRPIQNGKPPPLQFVTDDCAKANPACSAKLARQGPGEGYDLQYEGRGENYGPALDFDVIVLGGTLGIFYGMALQLRGLEVCVVAPRELKGQEQEWNVSMEDLLELHRLGILSMNDIDAATTTVFTGTRVGFKNREFPASAYGDDNNPEGGFEFVSDNLLNLGVSPAILIERTAERFRNLGGVVMDRTPLKGVVVSESSGAAVQLGSYEPNEEPEPITANLVVDCLGYGSPIARQCRYGQKPDSICVVFGSCAAGYNEDRNTMADIMYTFSELEDKGNHGKHQYFWESFPVGTYLTKPRPLKKKQFSIFNIFSDQQDDNSYQERTIEVQEPQVKSNVKTTYMFTYIDAEEARPSLESMMDDYWQQLPKYQPSISDPERDLDIKRVVYDFFPAYRDAPLKPQWSRVLSVGEAAGMQSAISFGGFRSLSRNIDRISGAITEAVENGCLHRDDLAKINAYTPNLSASWLIRDLMSVPLKKGVDPEFINRLLSVYLKGMHSGGKQTTTPFLQDVVRFDALASTLLAGIVSDPLLMGEIMNHIGMPKLIEFLSHVSQMGTYALLDKTASPVVDRVSSNSDPNPRAKFQRRRQVEAWKYGSGNDYQYRDYEN